METNEPILKINDLNFFYEGTKQALKNLNLCIEKNSVTALIGPSGCGKTTFLRCFNRMHDLYPGTKYSGEIIYKGNNILSDSTDLNKLRVSIGMVFQKPSPFPGSIIENAEYGLRLQGMKDNVLIREKAVSALKDTGLWDEVKDRLDNNASELSGGQQQRLCIARSLAVEPDIMLFDEPTSALDPISTAKIEELVKKMKQQLTVVIVTHNMQQAERVSDNTAFMYLGEIIEYDKTKKIFENPSVQITKDYINGNFG